MRGLWDSSECLWGPSKSEWGVYGVPPKDTTRFRTIDLSSITGMTFFYCDARWGLQGVHIHTREAPFSVLPPESRLWCEKPVWVYVPVPAKDDITALAVMNNNDLSGVGGLIVRPYQLSPCSQISSLSTFSNSA